MESAVPSASEPGLDKVDNFAICVGDGAKAKKENHKANTLMKIVIIRSQNMLKTTDQVKQQNVSEENIQLSGSRQSEVFWKNTMSKWW